MYRVKPPCLPRETRRAFDEPTLAGNGVDEPEARGVAPHRHIAPRIFAAIFFATRLWETTILCGAKHDGKGVGGRLSSHRSRRNGCAREELATCYFHVLFFNGRPLVVRI